MDSRSARDSRTIEEIGLFHPIEIEDKQIRIDEERAKYWLSKGAQPSDTVRSILNKKNISVK
jgi:small subunit ribosomal protein S16